MKCFSIALAWMLVGTAIFDSARAEDAASLPSVMVQPRSEQPGPAVPPQTLPEMSDAKPLLPAGDVAVAAADSATSSPGDGKLILPNPPETDAQSPAIKPAQYEETLPPPTGDATGAASGGPLAPINSVRPPVTNSVVAPPATTTATADLGAHAAAHAAADLLKGSLSSEADDVRRVSLAQFLERCPETQRAAVVQAYWQLSRAYSNSGWARDEQKRLEEIVPSRGSVESPMLSTARGAAAARLTEAELDFTKALAGLDVMTASLAVTGKYSPVDSPLVGPYHTYYSQIFANRPHARALQIDRTLPIRLKAINDWAATVHSATSAVHYAEQAHAKGEVDLRTVLACHDDLRAQRRKFLDAVLQYNLDIAEYAVAASPVGTTAEKFASMLIPTKPPERVSAAPGRLSPLVGVDPNKQPPRSDGWVPSTLRSLEPETPPVNAANPAVDRYNQGPSAPSAGTPPVAQPVPGRPADPFANPAAGSRYGVPGR